MDNTKPVYSVLVCVNKRPKANSPCCGLGGNERHMVQLQELATDQNLDVLVEPIVCLGQCKKGPVARIAPGGEFFFNLSSEKLQDILDEVIRLQTDDPAR